MAYSAETDFSSGTISSVFYVTEIKS